MSFHFVRYECRGPIGWVTLDRPPVNAVSQDMYQEIRELFGNLDLHLPGIRVLVLQGAGPHFCAGNDLDEFLGLDPDNSPGRMRTVREAFYAIQDCPVPVVGLVHGMVAGTGVAIAASCDVLIAGEGTRLATPEVGVGVMGGARHLARLLPEPVMRLMYFTADPVAEIVAVDQLDAAGQRLAERIGRHSRAALRMAKESLNATEWLPLKEAYEMEQANTSRLSGHSDSLEARQSVRHHRKARYSDAHEPVTT
jgi:enoyl-CoA hydratase